MIIDYDKAELLTLLKSFYDITGFRIGISDAKFNGIVCYPDKFCDFCTFLRTKKEAGELCYRCDEEAFEKAKNSSDIYLYECHAGLTEACCKLVFQNELIGYIVIGQIATTGTPQSRILSKCSPICTDLEKLITAFDAMKKVDKEFINSSITILKVCIQYIYMKGMLKVKKDPLANRLENYIDNNIKQKFVAGEIAKELRTNRTAIFACSKDNFGLTLTQLIEQKRLKYACELLKDSGKSIAEISEMCGFSDANYFSNRFKKHFGVSPNKRRFSLH